MLDSPGHTAKGLWVVHIPLRSSHVLSEEYHLLIRSSMRRHGLVS